MPPLFSKTSVFLFIGSACGLGLLPFAPGTFGALFGVLCHVLAALLLSPFYQEIALLVIFLLVCAANHLLTPWEEAYWHEQDPKHFVLDEVAGYLLVPILFHYGRLWQIAFWGFLLFRVLDIIKIPPARQIDRNMHGAWGILLDDLVSACYAVLIMYGLWWAAPKMGLEAWLFTH